MFNVELKEDVMVDKTPEVRTEDEKIMQDAIKVILGGKEYSIAPLVIRDSREWRKKVGPWKAALSKYASVDSDKPEEFAKALTELMVDRIDETIAFFFEYAKDLDPEEIKGLATDAEICKAFNKVFEYAFPFE